MTQPTLDDLTPRVHGMLIDSGALLSGHFILTSGRHSANYMQCALLCSRPDFCAALASDLADHVRDALGSGAGGADSGPDLGVDLVVAPALGGVVIGYEVARQLGLRGLFTERDKEGVMRLRRGFDIPSGSRVLLVEDVITTGGSVLEVDKIVREMGATTVGYACLFDRSGGAFAPGPPVFSVARVQFPTYAPGECPLCAAGSEAVKPGSRR